MALNRTFTMIKPDAVENGYTGAILAHIEKAGFKIVAMKLKKLTTESARNFYKIHEGRPFFPKLVEYMTSAPVFVQVLEGDNAVLKNRELMGATDPKNAKEGTIRKLYGVSIDKNSVHGSDSVANAKIEIDFFFNK